MIGSEDDLCHWMCPFDHKKKKEIGSITMLMDFSTTDQARASLLVDDDIEQLQDGHDTAQETRCFQEHQDCIISASC